MVLFVALDHFEACSDVHLYRYSGSARGKNITENHSQIGWVATTPGHFSFACGTSSFALPADFLPCANAGKSQQAFCAELHDRQDHGLTTAGSENVRVNRNRSALLDYA